MLAWEQACCGLAIAGAAYGDGKVKHAVLGIYTLWLLGIGAVQYTHPWTGSPPESFMDMPMPLVLVLATIVGIGAMMEKPKGKKA